jgi:hypothetical protein
MDRDLKRKLIADCKPEEPIEPGDRRHFDFDAPEYKLRGTAWRERLATFIDLATDPTVQLVTGLRGSGKTTELRQLSKVLTEQGYRVVMADVGQWLSDGRPVSTEDLMLALVLSVFPDGKPEGAQGWAREYATQVWEFLKSEVKLGDVGVAGLKARLTTDESVFQAASSSLREHDGLRQRVHTLLEQAAAASRADGRELVLIIDGAEKRALGELYTSDRREEFHNHWFGAFIVEGRDLKPPVHTIYTVPPFMIRRASELTANFGSELQFLPMVRLFRREGGLDFVGVEAMSSALFRRVERKLFADSAIPRWLVAHSGGYFRDLLRFVTEMVLRAGQAEQFTREHAEAAVEQIRQTYLQALVLEDKDVLRRLHPHKQFPDAEAAQRRMDSLLQGFKMFRYHNGSPWYDAHPLSWAELGFPEDLPSWADIERLA